MLVALITQTARMKPLKLPVEEAPRASRPAIKFPKMKHRSWSESKEDHYVRMLLLVLIALLVAVIVPLVLIVISNPDFIHSDISPKYDWTRWSSSLRPDRLGP